MTPTWKKAVDIVLSGARPSSLSRIAGWFCGLAAGAAFAVPNIQVTTFDDSPDPVSASAELVYSIRVENGGDQPANAVQVVTSIPAGTSFMSASDNRCAQSGGNVICDFATLADTQVNGGAPIDYEIHLRVTAVGGTTLNSTTTVTSTSADANPGNNSLSQTTTVTSGADQAVSVSGSNSAVGGGPVSYTVTVTNNGPDAVNGSRVRYTLPSAVTFGSASGSGWNCSASGQLVTCTRADSQAPGTLPVLTITGTVTGSSSGTVTGSVTVDATVTPDGIAANNTATFDTVVSSGTDLSLSKLASSPQIAGQGVTFTLRPRNNGPITASNVTVTDNVPAGFVVQSASGTGWSCAVSGQQVSCSRASYAVGASNDIAIVTTAPSTANLYTNTASIASSTTDPVPGNDTASVNVNIQPDQSDLSLTKTKTPDPVAQGSNMTSSIRVSNSGPSTRLQPIVVTDVLPAGESYVSGSGTNWNCSASGQTVTCSYSQDLANGASTPVLSIVTQANGSGGLANVATVQPSALCATQASQCDLNASNDVGSVSVNSTTAIADLRLSKTIPDAADAALAATDNDLTYRLTVTNDGPDTSTGITLVDVLPMATTGTGIAVSANTVPGLSCGVSGATVNCTGGSLANGASGHIDITLTRPLLDGSVTNQATVGSTQVGDPDHGNNLSSVTSAIDPVADIQLLSKTVTPTEVLAGVNATYVITIRNNGPSAAAGVSVTDTFAVPGGDTGFTFLSATASNGGSCAGLTAGQSYTGAPVLSCNWAASVASGATRTVTVVVRPNWMAAPPSPRTLSNTADVTTTTYDSDATNNSKSAQLLIDPAQVDLLINKTDSASASAGPDPLGFDPVTAPNNVIHYRVRVTNNGPSYASGIVFTDVFTPPAGKSYTFLCDKNAPGDACGATAPICNNIGQNFAAGAVATMTCTLPDGLADAASYTRYLAFEVQSAPAVGGDVYSDAVTVTRNEADTNAANDTAGETTTVRIRADIKISKTPSMATVDLFQPFAWNIAVTNNGPGDSQTTNVTDTLPAGMEFVGGSPVAASQGSCMVSGTQFGCNLGLLAASGNATISAQVRQTSYPAGGTISNTATVTTSEVDPSSGNNSATGTVTVQRASIAGRVYHDLTANGAQDGADGGLAGVTLLLTGTDAYGNAVSSTTTTNASGDFSFGNLPASDGSGYTLSETQPGGYFSVTNAVGGSGGSLSGDSVSGIVLVPGTATTGYLFGESRPVSVSGSVYVDANGSGAKDAGEGGIPNVAVTLTGTTGTGQAVNCSTVTNGSGVFSFPASGAAGLCANLPAGVYTLTESQPAGFVDGLDTAGTAGGSAGNDVIGSITLTSGTTASGYLFGESGSGLSGLVYVDRNGNGVRDGGEPGIAGVTVTLSGTDVDGNAVHVVTTTDSNGVYSLLQLPASNGQGYTLTESQPAAWGDGQDRVGTLGGTLGNDTVTGIVLGANQFGSGYDFGEVGGSLRGQIYLDSNSNGARDAAEPPLTGVTVTLTGMGADGQAINRTVTTDAAGHYQFDHLPAPDASGYTLTETQPSNYNDGQATVGSAGGAAAPNVISGIPLPAGGNGTGYDFGEVSAGMAALGGKVWFDYDHNRNESVSRQGSGRSDWTVQLLRNGSVAATTQTDSQGNYRFSNLAPSASATDYFEVRFVSPSGHLYGSPVSPDVQGQPMFVAMSLPQTQREQPQSIEGIYLPAGATVLEQSLPLDPSGVVYDSIRRTPVAGAVVRIDGPAGFDPTTQLVGGAANQSQTTDPTGFYQFLLLAGAPAGDYTLTVTSPAGYVPGVSTIIPACNATLSVGAVPNPALVQNSVTAPASGAPLHAASACPATSAGLAAGAGTTQYYLTFTLTPGVSANVVNNHIPVDPVLSGAMVVRKSTPMTNVQRGDLVPYTVTVQNTLAAALGNVDVRDQMPPGFKYRAGSATLNGSKLEPTVAGRSLTWSNLSFAAGETKTFKMVLMVGTGVGEGEYVNQAWALNNIVNAQISNLATAAVRVVPDPTFDCSDLIGKVFDDKNVNGYQDQGEPGIPGVRLATPRGLLVTTDSEGRFHVPCADIPNSDRGSNFVMKLDERTLPSGFRVTTENPRSVRLTRGKLVKLNFGATLHRVVRVELTDDAFQPGDLPLRPAFQANWQQVESQLRQQPSVLRLAYRRQSDPPELVSRRLRALHERIRQQWHEQEDSYHLQIEDEVMEVTQ